MQFKETRMDVCKVLLHQWILLRKSGAVEGIKPRDESTQKDGIVE